MILIGRLFGLMKDRARMFYNSLSAENWIRHLMFFMRMLSLW